MARPRKHDLDGLMDAAEKLAAQSGPAAVTVRALSESTGVSNGAIYHSFGSRAGLVATAWLRAADRFLSRQRTVVDEILSRNDPHSATEAVVAAADTPAAFLAEHPDTGKFLLTVSRDELLGSGELDDELAERLQSLDRRLVDLFIDLSSALWGRRDAVAVDVIRDCVVELPSALLLRGHRTPNEAVRLRLATAVRAVVSLDPPPVSC